MVFFVCIDSFRKLDVWIFFSGTALGDERLVFLRLYINYAVAQCGNHISERNDVARSEPALTLCTMNTDNACMLGPLHCCTNSCVEFSHMVKVVKDRLQVTNQATSWISTPIH